MNLSFHIEQSCFQCAKYARTPGNEISDPDACECPANSATDSGADDSNAACMYIELITRLMSLIIISQENYNKKRF